MTAGGGTSAILLAESRVDERLETTEWPSANQSLAVDEECRGGRDIVPLAIPKVLQLLELFGA